MTKILVIDDLRVFTFDAVYARTVEQGWDQIKHNEWDAVWMDHDMGLHSEDAIVIAERLEYRAVVHNQIFPIGQIFLHSYNPVGRQRMYQALHKHYFVIEVTDASHVVKKEDYRE